MSMGRWTPTTPEVRWHLGALVKKGIVKHLGDGLYELNLAFSSL